MFETTDKYFQNQLSAEERADFEKKILTDPNFADEVAFYIGTKQALQEKALQNRHAEWQSIRQKSKPNMVVWRVVTSMAAMLVLVMGWWFLRKPEQTLSEKANRYIEQNLSHLPTKMDDKTDSLELGKEFYNQKNYQKATEIFEKLVDKEPKALEYAGLSNLQQKEYDVAMIYFEKIEQNTELLENKGKFYTALTYLKQGDERRAKEILKEIIDNNLYGKNEAEKILE